MHEPAMDMIFAKLVATLVTTIFKCEANNKSFKGVIMKQFPDEQTMLELLKLANDSEQKLKALCDSTAELDEKWRVRLESRKEVFK